MNRRSLAKIADEIQQWGVLFEILFLPPPSLLPFTLSLSFLFLFLFLSFFLFLSLFLFLFFSPFFFLLLSNFLWIVLYLVVERSRLLLEQELHSPQEVEGYAFDFLSLLRCTAGNAVESDRERRELPGTLGAVGNAWT